MKLPNLEQAKKRNETVAKKIEFVFNDSFKNLFIGKTYFIKTYGCQMNEHDTEKIKALLVNLGFQEIDNYEEADMVILNTCSIRENAHNKAFGMLGRLKHLKETKKDLIVGICGCMAQEEKVVNEILQKFKWVNFVFGTHNLYNVPEILIKALDKKQLEVEVLSEEGSLIEGLPVERSNNYKAFVNIIYGCNKFCTYCIVPFTRGRERSRSSEDILKEINALVDNNYKEVTLLGQNVNAYGKDLNNNYTFANLLEDVAKTNIPRIRFMTSHPWDFTDEMIEIIAKYENIMPSIHLPIQSGSQNILTLMGRRYKKEDYIKLYDKIKEKIPRVTVSTDIIVGFPKEEEEDFQETLEVVDYCKFDNAFTFIFSKREGTAAAKIADNTSIAVKEERLSRLNEKVNKYFLENNNKVVGSTLKVLIEGKALKGNNYYGYSDTNKLVNVKSDDDIQTGDIVEVEITTAKTWSLDGKRIK